MDNPGINTAIKSVRSGDCYAAGALARWTRTWACTTDVCNDPVKAVLCHPPYSRASSHSFCQQINHACASVCTSFPCSFSACHQTQANHLPFGLVLAVQRVMVGVQQDDQNIRACCWPAANTLLCKRSCLLKCEELAKDLGSVPYKNGLAYMPSLWVSGAES